MPLVFVHGVATRKGPDYEESEAARNALFRSILFGDLVHDPASVTILNPYWGQFAAKPAFGHRSLPQGDYEAMGAEDVLPALALAETVSEVPESEDRFILDIARDSLSNAIDLLWVIAADGADSALAVDLGAVASRATAYADANPHPAWLDEVANDAQFLRDLPGHIEEWVPEGSTVEPVDSEWESYGALSSAWSQIRAAASRLKDSIGRGVSSVAVGLARQTLQENAALFLGDILIYLKERGKKDDPGPITKTVVEAIEDAEAARTPEDPHVIVVAHSMGGNVLYDIFSHFRPDSQVDVLVTVGSQPAFFEELKLFIESDDQIPGAHGERVPAPSGVGHWINIFDTQDVLSFVTEPIFESTHDYSYSTGKGVLGAHTTYFLRPSFYQRLAARISEVLDL